MSRRELWLYLSGTDSFPNVIHITTIHKLGEAKSKRTKWNQVQREEREGRAVGTAFGCRGTDTGMGRVQPTALFTQQKRSHSPQAEAKLMFSQGIF